MLRCLKLKRSISDINSSALQIHRTSSYKPKPDLSQPFAFGTITTDHLLEIDWTMILGWDTPKIRPYGTFSLDPCASVLHFATECFEGLKAYSAGDSINLFRPEMNMNRLNRSAVAVGLPTFDGEELLKCIKELVRLESEWIPKKKGYSVYIRPAMIGTHVHVSSSFPKSAKLFVVVLPAGPYFPEGFAPINLYCDESVIRSWPGGSGSFKIGANYPTAIAHTYKVNQLGYHQMLWLTNGNITEMGTMNFFCLWENEEGKLELVTSPLDSNILPGVTRDSILQLAKEWGEFLVTERSISIKELTKAIDAGKVIEIFGTGTACIVVPVGKIFYHGKDYSIPLKLGNCGELTKRMEQYLLGIQHGEIPHEWVHKI